MASPDKNQIVSDLCSKLKLINMNLFIKINILFLSYEDSKIFCINSAKSNINK